MVKLWYKNLYTFLSHCYIGAKNILEINFLFLKKVFINYILLQGLGNTQSKFKSKIPCAKNIVL